MFYWREPPPADKPANEVARWWGPAQVLASETRSDQLTRRPSHVVWIVSAGRLISDAPDQLRHASDRAAPSGCERFIVSFEVSTRATTRSMTITIFLKIGQDKSIAGVKDHAHHDPEHRREEQPLLLNFLEILGCLNLTNKTGKMDMERLQRRHFQSLPLSKGHLRRSPLQPETRYAGACRARDMSQTSSTGRWRDVKPLLR